MRFLVNFDGVADGKKTYHRRIYLQEEDTDGFLKRLAEKDSKIDGTSVVTVLRDDIDEEAKTSAISVTLETAIKDREMKKFSNSTSKTKRTFMCNICNKEFKSGFDVGKHKKKEHLDASKLNPTSTAF